MKKLPQHAFTASSLLLALTLAACGGGGGGGGDDGASASSSSASSSTPTTPAPPTDGVSTATINASGTDWVYYDLAANAVSTQSGTWHIAFNRYNLKLNGGSSGSGTVAGFLARTPAALYTNGTPNESALVAAKPADYLADLTATDLSKPAAASNWKKDAVGSQLSPAYTGSYPNALNYGFYSYYPTDAAGTAVGVTQHMLAANPTAATIVRSGGGASYARMHLTSIAYAAATPAYNGTQTWNVEFAVAPTGTSAFGSPFTWTFQLPASGSLCYDFDNQTEVAGCTGTAWDVKIISAGRTASFYTNSGESGSGNGAALGSPFTYTWADLQSWVNPTTDPVAGAIPSAAWMKDTASTVFSGTNSIASAVLEYGLGGTHLLYPSYRTFLITTDSSKAITDASVKVYALQFIGYYGGATGTTSGYPTIRWVEYKR
ncbi:MAG: HmuY family protein [Candidatus Dactylopiibacterium sp.]|nr:HmuY family protein [Candidatus Dactylopiibacterium sp.]